MHKLPFFNQKITLVLSKISYIIETQGGDLVELDKYKLNRNILCIDLKSFYATVECVLNNLDPFKTPLVVADKSRGDGSIVLAVSPYLREKGVPSRLRIHELPKNMEIIYARPQMAKYIEYSTLVIETYLEFVSIDDLYVYSIDEAFLDVTNYLSLYNLTDYELASKILDRIYDKLKLNATVGIGPNMLISKLALDIESKTCKNGIAKWTYDDINTKLHKVYPLSKMWGIGSRMERRLNVLGIYNVGDIANYSKTKLSKIFGVLGLELWYHSHGIDLSLISDKDKLLTTSKSYGSGQTLFKDYSGEEIPVILLEMTDEVTRRLRVSKKRAYTIKLSIGYSKSYGGGFSRQITLEQPLNSESLIFREIMNLFDTYYEGYPIRKVSISLSNLTDSKIYQYSLFEDKDALDLEYELMHTIDKIKNKYGKDSINRLSSNKKYATGRRRNKQIGGHNV